MRAQGTKWPPLQRKLRWQETDPDIPTGGDAGAAWRGYLFVAARKEKSRGRCERGWGTARAN
eukprot:9482259-Pyramimonas_sp.AAC.1